MTIEASRNPYALFATLETETGKIRRWRRGARGHAEKVGDSKFNLWLSSRENEPEVFSLLQQWRAAWEPPQDPSPSAPPTVRMARAA